MSNHFYEQIVSMYEIGSYFSDIVNSLLSPWGLIVFKHFRGGLIGEGAH